jgi:hypothetical protein
MTSDAKKWMRVWHIPQVPGRPFYVPVESVTEGNFIRDLLAEYDQFQLDENIKPDYCNASGIEEYDGEEWTEIVDDEVDGGGSS